MLLQCICSRSDDVLGRNIKVQRQWAIKTNKSDSQLVWIQVVKSPYYDRISFLICLLKNYPVPCKISIYTTKYFCVMYYDYFKSWNNTKKQVMLAEGQSSIAISFLSSYFYEWRLWIKTWMKLLSFFKEKEQHTHQSCTSSNNWSMLTKSVIHCKIKAHLHRVVWWF